MSTNNSPLEPWGLIKVSGTDTEEFLQGQLSNDINTLTSNAIIKEGQLTSYNSPKGRVLAVIYAYRIDDAIYLRLPMLLVQSVKQRLKMFVMRSNVTLDDVSDQLEALNMNGQSRQERIAAGIPTVYPDTQDLFIAQMLNLDTLNAINFKKGCYTGQEIIARMHYLGKLKRRMYRINAENADFQPGQPIYDSEGKQSIGNIVDGVGEQALAVLQTSKANQPLFLNSPDGPQLDVESTGM